MKTDGVKDALILVLSPAAVFAALSLVLGHSNRTHSGDYRREEFLLYLRVRHSSNKVPPSVSFDESVVLPV
jgi:hypothetical protein